MRRNPVLVLAAAAAALPGAARAAEPTGPAGWTAVNWIGLGVQLSLFALALAGLCRLAGGGRD